MNEADLVKKGEGMKISNEVIQWLRENAYAVKSGEHYFLPDFPLDKVPDILQIPITKKLWQALIKAMK